MRAYTCLVIFAVVSSPAHIFANEAPSDFNNAQSSLSEAATTKPLCIETMCPRLYMPVCAIVDGEQVTVPSRCLLNNKIRCASALERSLNQKVPSVRFLHSGSCSPKADKSIVGRMTRDMRIESDEEIIEVPNEEEVGAHEEDNGGNEEEESAHEEDNGGNEKEECAHEEDNGENEKEESAHADDNGANEKEESAHAEDNGENEEDDANEAETGEDAGAIEEEHDASNDKANEHAKIHNSGESAESGELNAVQVHNIEELEHLEDQADLDDKQAEADDAEAERDHAEEVEDEE